MTDDPVLINDWHAVARASAIKMGEVKAAQLLGRDLVLWRNQAGIHVWQDICIHRGAKLSLGKVSAECLTCPYHGWTYNSTGSCTHMPAHPTLTPPTRAQAQVYTAEEHYDLVWVCLGEPTKGVPPYPEFGDSTYRSVSAGPYIFKALGPRVLENFLDVGHFPYVHAGFLGDPGHPEIDDYEVESTEHGLIARDICVWQPDPDGTGHAAKVAYTYEALRPLTARFTKTQGAHRFAMIDFVSPISATESIAWGIMSMNYAFDIPDEKLREFQDTITAQDVPIVESQRPELLPLDLQAELHLRSDRAAIAYRKWLKKLGMTYGIA